MTGEEPTPKTLPINFKFPACLVISPLVARHNSTPPPLLSFNPFFRMDERGKQGGSWRKPGKFHDTLGILSKGGKKSGWRRVGRKTTSCGRNGEGREEEGNDGRSGL